MIVMLTQAVKSDAIVYSVVICVALSNETIIKLSIICNRAGFFAVCLYLQKHGFMCACVRVCIGIVTANQFRCLCISKYVSSFELKSNYIHDLIVSFNACHQKLLAFHSIALISYNRQTVNHMKVIVYLLFGMVP